MRPPGRHREDRRHGEEIGAGLRQRAVEMRKADIVAHAHAEPAPRRLGDDRLPAGAVGVALAIALAARQIDVEHVDFVVARDDRAARDRSGTSGSRAGSRRVRRPGSPAGSMTSEPSSSHAPVSRAKSRIAGEERVLRFAPRLLAAAPAALDQVAGLGGHDEIGAGVARPPHQIGDLAQIGFDIRPRRELDAGGRERMPLMRRSPASGRACRRGRARPCRRSRRYARHR